MNTDGTGHKVLKTFITTTEGASPNSLILSGSTLYGTTLRGGVAVDTGTIFRIQTDGSGYKTLKTFSHGADGSKPTSLILNGTTLYGTASKGGRSGMGTVFRMQTSGLSFGVSKHFSGGAGGAYPIGGLGISGTTLYGTTSEGGSAGMGTIFRMHTGGLTYSVIKSFNGTDGSFPLSSLTLSNGTLYGTTSMGNIFRVQTDGTAFSTLHQISGGAFFEAGLTLSNGTLYGTTSENSLALGNVFSVHTDGTAFTKLYEFASGAEEGFIKADRLILSDGKLYGSTSGKVFSVQVDGSAYTKLLELP
jgi:uncharacterized repeat protein (TIGR03803 family)